jgi:hypothetical protein
MRRLTRVQLLHLLKCDIAHGCVLVSGRFIDGLQAFVGAARDTKRFTDNVVGASTWALRGFIPHGGFSLTPSENFTAPNAAFMAPLLCLRPDRFGSVGPNRYSSDLRSPPAARWRSPLSDAVPTLRPAASDLFRVDPEKHADVEALTDLQRFTRLLLDAGVRLPETEE